MTLTEAKSAKRIWTSIFRRNGGDGNYTRLFDNLDPSQQGALLAEFGLSDLELPVIGSLQDSRNWLVLTTERLAWSIGGKRQELATTVIRDATADLRQLQRSEHSKLSMRRLQISTTGDVEYVIELEPGRPLIGVWNILRNVGARNRRPLGDSGSPEPP
jgi:hypothetical protein